MQQTLRQLVQQYIEQTLWRRTTPLQAIIPARGNKTKHIRDPLHGSIILPPDEVRLLDMVFMQRLRGIHQLGLAYLIFPSAGHSRFEHVLGVRFVAEHMLNRVEDVRGRLTVQQRTTVLMAALLHDIGHGVFSHVIESIISDYPLFQEQYQVTGNALHEQIGAIIITEDPCRTIITDAGINPSDVAALILHDTRALAQSDIPPELWGIISGPLDADKLDYFARDSYFSGIASAVDPDRILRTLTIGPSAQLSITMAGASALDQMLFDRVRMYSDLYGHQKILAAESMLRGLLETMLKRGDNGKHPQIFIRGNNGRSIPLHLDTVTDFLRMSDDAFLAAPTDSPAIADMQDRLLQRNLVHAAFTLSFESILENTVTTHQKYSDATQLRENRYLRHLAHIRQPATLREIRLRLHERHPDIALSDIWVAAVRSPSMNAVADTVLGRDGQPVHMGSIFAGWDSTDDEGIPTHTILRHFELYRARIIFFAPSGHAAEIHESAKQILYELFGLNVL